MIFSVKEDNKYVDNDLNKILKVGMMGNSVSRPSNRDVPRGKRIAYDSGKANVYRMFI